MQEHFNHTVGAHVSSNKQFDHLLKQRSDEMTQYTGIPHQLERVDMDDPKSLGVTREGLDEEQYARRGVDLDRFDFADGRMDDRPIERKGGSGEPPKDYSYIPADFD